jgi:hypothetical protein
VKVRKATLLFGIKDSPNDYGWKFEVTDISHETMTPEELDRFVTSKSWYTPIEDVGIELKTIEDFSKQEMYDLLASKMYGKYVSRVDLMQLAISKLACSRYLIV